MSYLELKIPPLIVAALAWLGMVGLTRAVPSATVVVPFGRAITDVLVAVGVAIALAGVFTFRRHRTTVHPHRPDTASTLVTSGVYRWTRNPMYVGVVVALTGGAVRLGNPLALVGIVALVLYLNRFQIGPEERALAARFGDAYDRYRRRVRRWI